MNAATFEKGTFQAGRVFVLSACHFIHDAYSSFLAPLPGFFLF